MNANNELLEKNLTRQLLHAGWGDPVRGLWFVGIEEGGSWPESPDSVAEWFEKTARDRIRWMGGMTYEHGAGVVGLSPARGSKVQHWVQTIVDEARKPKIAGQLSNPTLLWAPGSRVFNTNLYPLARPAVRMQPGYFRTHFGVSTPQEYETRVCEQRFPALRAFRDAAKPQAVVCFGKSFWPQFEKLFQLTAKDRRPSGDGKWWFHDRERIVLAPFFGYWHMNRDRASAIAGKLREWNAHS
jgi:hypothetical protein